LCREYIYGAKSTAVNQTSSAPEKDSYASLRSIANGNLIGGSSQRHSKFQGTNPLLIFICMGLNQTAGDSPSIPLDTIFLL